MAYGQPWMQSGRAVTIDATMDVQVDPTLAAGSISNTELGTDAVTNVKVAAAAAIAFSKLAALTRGSVISGQTAGNVPTVLDAKSSGQILVGDGTDLVSVAVSGDVTLASNGAVTIAANAVDSSMMDPVVIKTERVVISTANILAMNGAPVDVVTAPGAGIAIEFISATIAYTHDTADYTGGGDITINYSGGSAVSGVITKTNSFGASANKIFRVGKTAETELELSSNTALVITNATGAFTDPGTAAGTANLYVTYRMVAL